MKIANRIRGHRNHATGELGQALAKAELVRLGFKLVESVNTPWRIHRNPLGRIITATPVAKVSGDLRGIARGGISVLAEVKVREERLSFSQLEDHQVRSLDSHAAAGGVTLLVWVRLRPVARVVVMDWAALRGAIAFGPSRSIREETADRAKYWPT